MRESQREEVLSYVRRPRDSFAKGAGRYGHCVRLLQPKAAKVTPPANPSFERTAEKLRFSVPSALRASAAAQLKR